MNYTIEELRKAIKEANKRLEAEEGIDLLYHMQYITDDKESYELLEEILSDPTN